MEKTAKYIAVLILAAGASSRMGKTKQLMPWKETTLLGNAISNAQSLKGTTIYVVLGANAKEVKKKCFKPHALFIEHLGWKNGLGTSIAFGVKEILKNEPNTRAILILLGDQPLITPEYLNRMLTSFESSNKDIVASVYGKKLGVPALFGRPYFEGLRVLDSDFGAKQLLQKHKNEIISLDLKGMEADIDTPEDYYRVQEQGDSPT